MTSQLTEASQIYSFNTEKLVINRKPIDAEKLLHDSVPLISCSESLTVETAVVHSVRVSEQPCNPSRCCHL